MRSAFVFSSVLRQLVVHGCKDFGSDSQQMVRTAKWVRRLAHLVCFEKFRMIVEEVDTPLVHSIDFGTDLPGPK